MTTCPDCGSTDIGTRNRCKPCRSKADREAFAANPEETRRKERIRRRAWRRANPEKHLAQRRRHRYGIGQDEVDALLEAQGHRCKIYQAPAPNCLDHDHATGAVRGMLCHLCNVGLGHFRERAKYLRAAIRYLRQAAA